MPQSREVLDAVIISKLGIAMTAAQREAVAGELRTWATDPRRHDADRAYVRGIANFLQYLNHGVAA